jgi:hypothetical protein
LRKLPTEAPKAKTKGRIPNVKIKSAEMGKLIFSKNND